VFIFCFVAVGLATAQAPPPKSSASTAKPATPSLKAILAKLSPAVRADFYSSIYFVDGKVASVKDAEVKKLLPHNGHLQLLRALGWASLAEVEKEMACVGPGQCHKLNENCCEASACKGKYGSVGIAFVDLIRDVPAPEREKFLAGLDLRGGRLTRANLQPISRYVKAEHLRSLSEH